MLIGYEIQKIWKNRVFVLSLVVLIFVNLFLLWTQSRPSVGQEGVNTAYRTLSLELASMSPNEKVQHIQDHYNLMNAMAIVDAVEQQTALLGEAQTSSQRQENAEIYDMYFEKYRAGNYLRYMSNIRLEYSFISSIYIEMQQVARYEDYLNEIESRARSLEEISIFATNRFDMLNIEKTTADFEQMQNIQPSFHPQKGLYLAIGYSMTDFIILIVMLFIAFSVIRDEIDTGNLLYIHTMYRGRMATALAKLTAMGISLLVVTLILFGSNLVFCEALYGLGNLHAPIQSYYFLINSSLKCNLLQYLVLFFITKWAAIFPIGVWVLLACTLTRKASTGYILGLSFPMGCELLRRLIPATSNFNLVRYANIASLVQTNEILGNYRNLNILGFPIHLFTVEAVAALLYCSTLGYWFCRRIDKWQVRHVRNTAHNRNRTLKVFAPSMLAHEAYKILIGSGGALVLAIFVIVQLLLVWNTQSYIAPEEIYYRYYLNVMQGPLTREKVEWLNEQGEEFKPIVDLQIALHNGEIDAQTYAGMMDMYAGQLEKYNVYCQVYQETQAVFQTPGIQMIYENGYKRLFGIGSQDNLMAYLIVCLTVSVVCSPVFALEKHTQMKRIISTTPLGRTFILKAKLRLCYFIAAGTGLISFIPGFVVLLRDYWFSAPTAPIRSMSFYQSAPLNIPVIFLVILMICIRILASLSIALIVLSLSEKIGNTIITIIVSSLLFGLAPLLALSGIDYVKWLGAYPLFNFAAMMIDNSYAVLTLVYLVVFILAGGFCLYWLFDRYPQNLYMDYYSHWKLKKRGDRK